MYLNFLISISKTDDLLLTQLVTSPHEKRSRSAGWLIVVPLIVALSAFAFEDSLPPIFANQNHASAGALRDGILTIQLEIAKASGIRRLSTALLFPFMLSVRPDTPLQNPGPLIRLPQKTEIRASLYNMLPIAVTVHGLGGRSLSSVEPRYPWFQCSRLSIRKNRSKSFFDRGWKRRRCVDCTNQDAHHGPTSLHVRAKELPPSGHVQTQMMYLFNHPHYDRAWSIRPAQSDGSADRVLLRRKGMSHALIDNDQSRRSMYRVL